MTLLRIMKERQDRLDSLIESAMDAIVSTDGDQNIILFNRAAEQIFGHRAEDVIGQYSQRFARQRR